MFIKLDSKNYIVPNNSIKKIKEITNQLKVKRERLIQKGQISEHDFAPMEADFTRITDSLIDTINISDFQKDELKKSKNKNLLLKLNGDIPTINQWNILGFIEPIQGQKDKYSLFSYSEKDMPEQYRKIKNPKKCDHCETNRQRNKTFIIQNNDTKEVLQVGSTCMKDFISFQQLGLLFNLSSITNEIEKIAQKQDKIEETITFLHKEEFLALVLAFNKIEDKPFNPNKKNSSEYERSVIVNNVFDYFDFLDNDFEDDVLTKQKKEFFKSVTISEADYDEANLIIDFFEDIDPENYKDEVFNIKTLIGGDLEFLTKKEILNAANVYYYYDIIKNNKPELINEFAKYHEGIVINGKTRLLPQKFNKKNVMAALCAIGEHGDYVKNNNPNLLEPSDSSKAMMLIYDEYKEKHIQELKLEGYTEEDIKKFEEKINSYEIKEKHYQTAENILDYIKTHKDKSNSFFQSNMINIALNIEDNMDSNEVKQLGFLFHYYKNAMEQDKKNDKNKKLEDKNIIRYVGAEGDKIGSINLKYKGKTSRDSEFGIFYIHNFEDKFGNFFSATSSKPNPFKTDDDKIEEKWASFAANIKKHETSTYKGNKQKVTYLNRIKNTTDFTIEEPKNNNIVLRSKYRLDELKSIKVSEYNDIYSYEFVDKKNQDYTFVTDVKVNIKQGDIIKSGFMISENKKEIFNLENKNILKMKKFSETDAVDLTPKQLEKFMSVKKEEQKAKKPKI